jgi:hypothetical protein
MRQKNPGKNDEYLKIEKHLKFFGISANHEAAHKASLLKNS